MKPQEKLHNLIQEDPRYSLPAYAAIHRGLDFTMQGRGREGHVSGQELALGMAGYLKKEYGPFARMVLEGWGIRSTEDFGRIVFNLVNAGLMRKQETDRIDDFLDVYDFDQMFDRGGDWLEEVRGELGLTSHKPDLSA